jgi:hypothetical protein
MKWLGGILLREEQALVEKQLELLRRFAVNLSGLLQCIEETSVVLSVSPATVKREWATARAWLQREMRNRETSA